LSWRFEWDWVKAEREFHRAIELSPSYVDAHQYFALYLAWRDRRAEALAQVAAVRELSPGLPMADWTAAVYYHVRDYNALLIASRNWLAMKADTWLAHFCVGVAYEGLGHRSEAIPEYQKAVALSEGDVDARAALAYAYGRSGVPEAKDMLNQLLRESQDHYVPPYMIATVYAGLGQKEKAFEFLEKAYEEKSPDMLWELNSDLRVDTLRSDPRFRDLISRLRVPN
jgi:tetratricopeptide (TPR) repeat protein